MQQQIEAKEAVQTLDEDDVIEIPQYKTLCRVNYVGLRDDETDEIGMVGLEFVGGKSGATKTLIVNQHSGRVYLLAGQSDKGEVTSIRKVSSVVTDGGSAACEWCGDSLDEYDDDEIVSVVRGRDVDRDSDVIAQFHDGDGMPCFGEARDYGWN